MPVLAPDLPIRLDRVSGRAKAHRALSASKRAETGYVSALLGVMRRVHATVLAEVKPELPEAETRHDALDDRFVKRLFKVTQGPVQLAFEGMAGVVEKSSAKGAALVGIKPRLVPGLASAIDQARRKNVQLIQSATQDFVDDVRDVLEETAGQSAKDIAKALQGRVEVSKGRAELIGRDQTLKLNAALTEHRQRAAGVSSFRWSSSKDERVREAHKELDGQVFSWDEGVPADVAEEVGEDAGVTPGEPVNCRCIAIPVLAALEGESEEAGEAEEPDYEVAAE